MKILLIVENIISLQTVIKTDVECVYVLRDEIE